MLRPLILAAARSPRLRRAVAATPVTKSVVRRFVAGESLEDAIAAIRRLTADGLLTSLDHLGEDTHEASQAQSTAASYVRLLERLAQDGLADRAEVSVKLTAVGLDISRSLALEQAGRICEAASRAGTTVTVDMEDSARTQATLEVVRALRRDHPSVGAVLQAYLRRTEEDCRSLAGPGSRVRLCKGAYREPAEVAYQDRAAVAVSYARCMAALLAGQGYPMLATHDPALLALAGRLASRMGRTADSYEFQLLYGVRPEEQRRLVAAGHQVRVYVPYGDEWYGYLMRRLAERPANLGFFLRALASRS
ncbi:MAG: proline dehydrogenase family protein [Mycobacteriales bacterium]